MWMAVENRAETAMRKRRGLLSLWKPRREPRRERTAARRSPEMMERSGYAAR